MIIDFNNKMRLNLDDLLQKITTWNNIFTLL